MKRPSSIDKLPPEIRAQIEELRNLGWTIDQIREHLAGLLDQAPSRSAIGRHIVGMNKITEDLNRSRAVAEVAVRAGGHEMGSKIAQLNIELLHSVIMKLFLAVADGGDADAMGRAALAGDPEGLMFLARAVKDLGNASKTNADWRAGEEARIIARAQRELIEQQQKKLDQMENTIDGDGKPARGFDPETLRRVRVEIYGLPG